MGKYEWSDFQNNRREQRRPREKKRLKPIPKKSAKRIEDDKVYFAERDLFLMMHKECQLNVPGCTRKATEIHHKAGRIGAKYLDKKYWAASCRNCNGWVEVNSAAAKKKGWKISKFSV